MKRLIMVMVAVLALVAFLIPSIPAAASGPANAPRIPITRSTSSNWSGYAVPEGNVTDVQGQWTVPPVSGSSKSAYSAIWVGIDGYSSSTVEQIGTEQDYVGGQAQYYAWYEMYPDASNIIPYTVNPGDAMSAEVSYDININEFTLTLNDNTQNWTYTTSAAASSSDLRNSAEWIVEAPSMVNHVLPLANFGTVSFSNAQATINGNSGTISNWANDPITMVDGKATSTPSVLSSDGSSFTVTYSTSSSGGGGGGHGNGGGGGHGKSGK